jgi:Arc/MetJ-type ribon-helix-helix transcriptional regulator
MVYDDTMSRTQVYLDKEDLDLLDAVAAETGASRSELIRRAVRRAYGEAATADRLRALGVSAGSWTGREFTGSEYVEALRGDLSDRLRRLGMK